MSKTIRVDDEVWEELQKRAQACGGKPNAVLRQLVGLPSKRKDGAETGGGKVSIEASAGAWKGIVDTEALKRHIYENRLIQTRPEPKL